MGRSSYEIQEQAFRAAAGLMELVSEDGEIVDEGLYDEWMASVDEVFAELGDKLCALRAVEERIGREADQLRLEAKRHMDRARQRDGQVERVRGYMMGLLLAHEKLDGEPKCATPDGSFIMVQRRKGIRVEVTDRRKVPGRYLVEVDPKVDKKAIKAEYESGDVIPGVCVSEPVTEFIRKGA